MWWSIVIQSKQWLCGFLKLAFWRFSEKIRVAESIVSPGTHRWVVAFHFLFTRLSLYFKPRSYFSMDEMKCLEGLVSRYFAGFLRVSMHDTERVVIFFFSWCSCVEQEIMRRPLTVRAAATDKQEKKLVRCRAGALEYRVCRVWHVTSRLLPSYRDYRSKFRWLFRVFSLLTLACYRNSLAADSKVNGSGWDKRQTDANLAGVWSAWCLLFSLKFIGRKLDRHRS